jgi:hypothetical protein
MSCHRTLHGYAPLRVHALIQRVRAERTVEADQHVDPQWPREDRDGPYVDPHAACRFAHRRLVAPRRSTPEHEQHYYVSSSE